MSTHPNIPHGYNDEGEYTGGSNYSFLCGDDGHTHAYDKNGVCYCGYRLNQMKHEIIEKLDSVKLDSVSERIMSKIGEDIVTIPITLNHDHTKIIGKVIFDKNYFSMFPKSTLSPGYIEDEDGNAKDIIDFGVVLTDQYINSFKNGKNNQINTAHPFIRICSNKCFHHIRHNF